MIQLYTIFFNIYLVVSLGSKTTDILRSTEYSLAARNDNMHEKMTRSIGQLTFVAAACCQLGRGHCTTGSVRGDRSSWNLCY
jgi:hypothetical protein